ncbi:MAG TPA: hypothetical protein PLQ93_11150 [Bacteroidia bacterium]|nr:hypothetical protein [Bacteroidia bacterium]
MKNNSFFNRYTLLALSLVLTAFLMNPARAQSDTLRLYYLGMQTKVADSNETKIANWAKSLKGKHVDADVFAYYADAAYKKFAVERSAELELIINRKAREIVSIKSIGPKKAAKSLRSRVDIVYTIQGSAPAAQASAPANTEAKKDSLARGADHKKEKAAPANTTASENKVKEKGDAKHDYVMDTVYVNGVMKVTKRKVKKQ